MVRCGGWKPRTQSKWFLFIYLICSNIVLIPLVLFLNSEWNKLNNNHLKLHLKWHLLQAHQTFETFIYQNIHFLQYILFFYFFYFAGAMVCVCLCVCVCVCVCAVVKLEGDSPAVRDQFQDCKHGGDALPFPNSEKVPLLKRLGSWLCTPPTPSHPFTQNIPAPPTSPPPPPFPLRVSCCAG